MFELGERLGSVLRQHGVSLQVILRYAAPLSSNQFDNGIAPPRLETRQAVSGLSHHDQWAIHTAAIVQVERGAGHVECTRDGRDQALRNLVKVEQCRQVLTQRLDGLTKIVSGAEKSAIQHVLHPCTQRVEPKQHAQPKEDRKAACLGEGYT